jgi:hypothetical protein
MLIRTTLALQTTCRAEANRWERHGSAYRVADAAPQRRAGPLASLFLLQHAAPSRLWLGVGQLLRMVKQS